jgi:hypothetical protein
MCDVLIATRATRRSRNTAAAADGDETPFAMLPPAVLLHILSLLPADARLRACEVCRGWRDALAERSAWARLDVSDGAGLAQPATLALFRAAAARAGGRLAALDVSGCTSITHEPLLAVVTANSGALTELRVACCIYDNTPTIAELEDLCRAAPRLATLHADAYCFNAAEAARLLRGDAPFAAVRPCHLMVDFHNPNGVASALALAADLAAHAAPSLTALTLDGLDTTEVFDACVDAFVDIALARRLEGLSFASCPLTAACVPAVCRLLTADGGGAGALRTLKLYASAAPGNLLLDLASAAALAAALRTHSTLTSLSLSGAALWTHPAAAASLFGALTGHASLRELNISGTNAHAAYDVRDATVVGALLAALVAANAPALTALDASNMLATDDVMRPFVDALPLNTHLRTLSIGSTDMSDVCLRDNLLPAFRANTGLRTLDLWHQMFNHALLAQVVQVMADRGGECKY